MSLKARIRRLEERRGFNRTTPPIAFFDRVVAGTLTEEEWRRWLPWINEHYPQLLADEVANHTPPGESQARMERS